MARPPASSAQLTRRRFVQGAAAAVTATGILGFPAILRGKDLNSKLNIAFIACGGRGNHNLRQFEAENVAALCDVDDKHLQSAAKAHPNAKTFRDFRKLYDTLKDSEFDAVVVSTPEHTHALATLPGLLRKKHVFCEKPLTHNVREARLVAEVAAKAGVATQMGTQVHGSENYRRVVELVQANAIGPIHECHVWVSRAWGWQRPEDATQYKDIVSTQDRPAGESPVPSYLDWDLWVGPAPMRPFHEVYFPGPRWYRWWEWGSGTMSDLGSHWNDLPWWALKLDSPLAVEAAGPPAHPDLAPASMSATYEYGPRGTMPAVKLTWHQGTSKPKVWTEGKIPQWQNGVLFVGGAGMLLADYSKHTLLPKETFESYQRPPKTIPPAGGGNHHAEWIKACKEGTPTGSPFATYAGPLTEANHLGNVAYRAGKRIEWDAKNLKIPNAPEAEKFLGREYRKGWELPS